MCRRGQNICNCKGIAEILEKNGSVQYFPRMFLLIIEIQLQYVWPLHKHLILSGKVRIAIVLIRY